ncbi:hypothetical protein M5K25_001488 [Dendrobium thyrsiflorum]|uniref:Uncharacterized protein n=1 Tax=Dendrobium thyrsiflorum TaxID=117978 RepID=A0ABD0VQI0_DENTH
MLEKSERIVRGIKPSPPFVKLNSNGSVGDCCAGMGGFIHNHLSGIITAYAGPLKSCKVITVELCGLAQGLDICRRLEISHVLIEVDALLGWFLSPGLLFWKPDCALVGVVLGDPSSLCFLVMWLLASLLGARIANERVFSMLMGSEYPGRVITQGFDVTLTLYFPHSTNEGKSSDGSILSQIVNLKEEVNSLHTEMREFMQPFRMQHPPQESSQMREFQKSSLSSTCLRVEGKRGRAREREEEIYEGEFVREFTKVAPSKGSVHLLRASSRIFEGLGGVHFSEKRRFSAGFGWKQKEVRFSAGFGWKQKEVRFSASFRRKRKESKVLCLTGLVKRSVCKGFSALLWKQKESHY